MAPYFLKNWIPKREQRVAARPLLTVLSELTWLQWAHFASGYVTFFLIDSVSFLAWLKSFSLSRWLAWTCDAIDFFSVSLTVPLLQKQFNKSKASTIVRLHLGFLWP